MRFTFFISLLLFSLLAKSQEFTFERISSNDGLSQNNVINLFQDSQGYMWVSTHEGVNRYDGMEFKIYRISENNSNSISGNLIKKTVEDSKGNLWFATLNNGISMFNPRTEKFKQFKNTEQNPNFFKSNASQTIFCDSKDRIFLGNTLGLDYLEQDENGEYQVQHVLDLPDSIMNGEIPMYFEIYEDSYGDIIVLMKDKIAKIHFPDKKNNYPRLEHIFVDLPFLDYRTILEFDGGYLIGHGKGLSHVKVLSKETNTYKIKTTPVVRVAGMVLLEDSTIWVGSSDFGVYRFKYQKNSENCFIQTHHFTEGDNEYSISDNTIDCIAKDNSNGIWIGSNGGGICKLNMLNRQFRLYKSTINPGSISTNKVFSIYEDKKKNIWIGTEGGGINFLSHEKEKDYSSGFVNYYNNIPNEQHIVFDICPIKSQVPEIWIGTAYEAKIARIKQNRHNWEVTLSHIPIDQGMVMTILQDENECVWLGTYQDGLYKATKKGGLYEIDHFNVANSNISSNTIRNIFEDSKGRLWLGSADGLMLLDNIEKSKEQPDFKVFKNSEVNDSSLSYNYILPIIESKDSSIWIGTMGGGLNKYIEGDLFDNGYFKRLTVKDGLPNNTIKEIVEDNDGNFWIGSNQGLTKYNPTTNRIRNFNYKDGLQSSEFVEMAGCKLHDGEILMGGVNGFSAFYPDDITEDTNPPRISFTSLEIMDEFVEVNEELKGKIFLKESLNSTEEIVLQHTENNFTIHFVALHFSNPEYNQYKYQLVGYDPQWIETSSKARFAKYTNLDAGKYTFQVLASNSDGYWSPEAKTIKVIIEPPFWGTLWFKLVIVFFILSQFVAFYLWKINSMKVQKRNLEKEVEERTSDMMEMYTEVEENHEEIIAQKEAIQFKNSLLESKSSELEFHKLNLERLVEERTVELKEALVKAEQSDKLKTSFLANMSHEIRTPMNAIIGFTELLENVDLNNESRTLYRELVKTNSEKLLLVIDDILSLSLIESNQLHPISAKFEINSLLEENLQMLNTYDLNPEIKLNYINDVEEFNLQIYSDQFRINQVISNLLSNAVKFTHDGEITFKANFDKEKNLLISVKDTGIGISEENIKHIFDRFRKIEGDNTNLYPGVGLGLTISYKLSQLLRCKLWAESEKSVGSQFYFMIPANLIVDEVEEPEEIATTHKPEVSWKGKRVLVVDDVSENFRLLDYFLKKQSCDVYYAKNGLKAVELIAKGDTFDAILMDIKMPVMNGIDALSAIRKITPGQYVIAQTAFAFETDREKFLRLGFNDYITKPLKKDMLYTVMQQCFNK